jgi:hypothetical protein
VTVDDAPDPDVPKVTLHRGLGALADHYRLTTERVA